MYILASRRVVVKTNKAGPGGATFATVDGVRAPGKTLTDDGKGKDGNGKQKTAEQKYQERLAKMKCYNCGEKGHIAKNCPHAKSDAEEEDEDEPPLAGLTLACCATTKPNDRLFEYWEICLDSGSQINIVDPRLLNNLHTASKTFRSMNGVSTMERVGFLDGFFECHACDNCPANILSMADVEDRFAITWTPGDSIVVHLEERDIIFTRMNKMWVGDFSDWIITDEERRRELRMDLSLLTVKDKEDLYTKREVTRALEAGEFLKSMGYPTKQEALGIVRDGNVKNIPYTAEDINRFYDIYGPQVAGIRGKTMKKKAKRMVELDRGAQMQVKLQELSVDVMHTAGYKSLVSVCKPLGLTLIDTLKSLTTSELGRSLQAHINTLRSKGFEPAYVYADPQKGFKALEGSFPGVAIDVSGAGDHLAVVDTKIRRVKEIMRSIIAGLPYRLPKDRVKDLAMFAVNRTNLKSTGGLVSKESPRVRFTGIKPEYKTEFGLGFGDYVEAYNPRAEKRSNDVTMARTEPCIALYPSANRNGSWIFWNLCTKTYVRRTQWRRLPTSQTVIDIMNDMAGLSGITLADIPLEGGNHETSIVSGPPALVRHSDQDESLIPTTEEMAIDDEGLGDLPELTDQYEEDSDDESEDEEEAYIGEPEDGLDAAQQGLAELLEVVDSSEESSGAMLADQAVPLRRTARENAGHKRYDTAYDWNLLNLSVGAAIKTFGNVAEEAVTTELVQLFREKKALVPVHKASLSEDQKKNLVRSHMFVTEKFEDGKFVKMKGRVVADGRMQDRTVYTNYSAPTAKTRSVMTCLKLAAVKGWDLLKLDVGGAFLCAPIGEEEVYMILDKDLANKVVTSMPEYSEYLGDDGKLVVRVDKAMYGLIQSAKLWYDELTRLLMSKGFKRSTVDECVLVKQMPDGEYIIVVLYVDDILVIGRGHEDCHWVKGVLEAEYKKITFEEGEKFTYLGMTIVKKSNGFEISMKSYVEDIMKLYGKQLRTCVTPAKSGLFDTNVDGDRIDSVLFHSIVAKLLYLGKRGRPDILLPVQYLCTRVKNPTSEDQRKLERVLGYLMLSKNWNRVLDDSPFTRVTTYIDASFAMHADGKSQSACMIFLGNTLVHEGCRKQKLITRNSTEAELVALSDYLEEGELIEAFVAELGDLIMEELITDQHVVYQDNQSTIKTIMNAGGKMRSKYMKVRAAYVAERLGTHEVGIEYLPTRKMVADLLTKPLGGDLFHRHAQMALGRIPAVCNRGAKEKVTYKRHVDDLAVNLASLTCTQPGQNTRKKQTKETRDTT